ncbi:MAG: calcium-translocating P-type ATPase, PMCA-type [Thermoguttaceae bacterium]|nr:calcium-translocating P-type ATPase, PMCA-type [Thermoguttaceae bacterium]
MQLKGLTPQEVEKSRRENGSNALTQIPPEPLWKKILAGFKDPMIMILLVALAVQLVLLAIGETEWYEPLGVLVAILIANLAAALSENRQQGKASALKAEEEAKETTKVLRDGQLAEIHVNDVVLGDLVYLQAGDKIPADGVVVEGAIKVDQSPLNGETVEATKRPVEPGETYDAKDTHNEHYGYRGSVVCGGEGYMEIKVVGDATVFGQIAAELQEHADRKTPLQVKLTQLAGHISKFGYIGASAIVVGVLARAFVSGAAPTDAIGWVHLLMNAITVAVTIIVCAVPEGLPMLTSLLQSFQSLRMVRDNVLVRKIHGLETAGSLSLLYSDKTGTITEGRLSVEELALGDATTFNALKDAPTWFTPEFIVGVGVNNSATVGAENAILGGNSSDRALMTFLAQSGVADSIDRSQTLQFNPFDSEKKKSSVVVKRENGPVVYVKGAAERVIEQCDRYLDANGQVQAFTDKSAIEKYSLDQAARSMRLLAVAKADGENDEVPLTLVGVIGIRDAVRKEAAEAIAVAQNAGIQVVMITGDRKETAVAIAKESGLLRADDEVALTSAELGAKSDDEVKALLPKLRVVARALPSDKSRLVTLAQELNLVVGMTGDGVNDSPALKKADVGFAMGSGTEVAKEAGEITILDDNFKSIAKAILYGRTIFKSIRKFLIFQLTVNVAAVLTCFLGPMFGVNVVLTVVQLLLVNLVMDTLAALAFGAEPALLEYMKEKPIPRSESVVTKPMLAQIVIGALFITAISLSILFVKPVRGLFETDAETRAAIACKLDAETQTSENAETAATEEVATTDETEPVAETQTSESVEITASEEGATTDETKRGEAFEEAKLDYLRSAVFAFFMMAIAFNGFNARTDKLNVLHGLSKNPTFLIVFAGVFALQFVFVTFGGKVLHVQPLSASSWLCCALLAFAVVPLDMIRKFAFKR